MEFVKKCEIARAEISLILKKYNLSFDWGATDVAGPTALPEEIELGFVCKEKETFEPIGSLNTEK